MKEMILTKEILELNRKKIIENKIKYLFKNIGNIGIIGTALLTIVICLIRVSCYFYIRGKFTVFNIDSVYINSDGGNLLYESIFHITIAGVYILANYFSYCIIVNINGKRKTLYFIFYQLFISVCLFLYTLINNNLQDIHYSATIVIVLILLLFIVSCFFTANGIIIGISDVIGNKNNKHKSKNKTKKNNETKGKIVSIKKTYRIIFIIIFVVYILEMFTLFGYGYSNAKNQRRFKIIDGNYAVIYEDREQYILAECVTDSNYIKEINFDKQKIISKIGVETIEMNMK